MKKKLVAVMMCAAMVAMLGVGCGSKSSDDSSSKSETKKTLTENDIKDSMKGVKLKVGTTGLFGPFSYYDEDGKTLIGYDLDLINDLQDLLGFEIDGGIQAMDYSALTTSLAENKLDMGETLEEISQNIFTLLRKVDSYNVNLVIIEGVEKKGLGLAIMNRLIRACEHNYIEI